MMKRYCLVLLLFCQSTLLAMEQPKIALENKGSPKPTLKRRTLRETLLDQLALTSLAFYRTALKSMQNRQCSADVAEMHESTYQAMVGMVSSSARTFEPFKVMECLITEYDQAEIFARHVLYVHKRNLYHITLDLGSAAKKSIAEFNQERAYMLEFSQDARLQIYISLLKLNPPFSLMTVCEGLFDRQHLDDLAKALRFPKYDFSREVTKEAKQEIPQMSVILKRIEDRLRQHIDSVNAIEPIVPVSDLFKTITSNVETADPMAFLSNYGKLLSQYMTEERYVQERAENVMRLRAVCRPQEFEGRVRSEINDLHVKLRFDQLRDSQELFLKYLLLHWAIKDINYVPLADEIIAILLYGKRICNWAEKSDDELRHTADEVLHYCDLFIKNYPSAEERSTTDAVNTDARAKMLRMLTTGGAEALTELLSRYIKLWATDTVHKEKENVLGSKERTKLYDTMATLIFKMSESLRLTVLTEFSLPNDGLLKLNQRIRDEYFICIVDLFLPYFLANEVADFQSPEWGNGFCQFFALVRNMPEELQLTINIKEVMSRALTVFLCDDLKKNKYMEIMNFEFDAASKENLDEANRNM